MSAVIDDDLASLGLAFGDSQGQLVAHVAVSDYHQTVRSLLELGFEMCVDVTAADYLRRPDRQVAPEVTPQRFELVVNLLDLAKRRRIRLRMQVADGEVVPSITDIHPGAEAMEREVFDMFGITFSDHPDLTRILLPETWVGHPLRKDYASGRIPVQFKGAHQGR